MGPNLAENAPHRLGNGGVGRADPGQVAAAGEQIAGGEETGQAWAVQAGQLVKVDFPPVELVRC